MEYRGPSLLPLRLNYLPEGLLLQSPELVPLIAGL